MTHSGLVARMRACNSCSCMQSMKSMHACMQGTGPEFGMNWSRRPLPSLDFSFLIPLSSLDFSFLTLHDGTTGEHENARHVAVQQLRSIGQGLSCGFYPIRTNAGQLKSAICQIVYTSRPILRVSHICIQKEP